MADNKKVPVTRFQDFVLACVEAGDARLSAIHVRIAKDGDARCMLHAHMNADGAQRPADRVIDRALQYLRKHGLIEYQAKTGWTVRALKDADIKREAHERTKAELTEDENAMPKVDARSR